MAKNQIKPETLDANNGISDVSTKQKKVDAKKQEKKAKAKKEQKPKRSRTRETFAELKKVTWPTFGKTMAQTGMVISVVAIFALLVLGVDLLLGWLFGLISG